MRLSDRIFVAGHRGFVGSGLVRLLQGRGHERLILRTRQEVDLTSRDAVFELFRSERPDIVILAAARVGGIAANMSAPVEFLLENLWIQNNVLEASGRFGARKVAFLGSSCVYPREAPQPMSESSFMHGPLEPTNESYAVAKIAGLRLAQALHEQNGLDVICPMPANVYGRGDHFDLDRSHVMSALVKRFVDAKRAGITSVTLWGTGAARREFLHVDDLADAVLFLLEHYSRPDLVNVGTGEDSSIQDLASVVAEMVDYEGKISWDSTRPDGMPRKLLDVSKIRALGWHHRVELRDGIREVIADYYERYAQNAQTGSRA